MWVPPFGYRRINSCLQIPGAFRSLPRPSSLLEAKASSVRSSSLSRTYKWINFATFFSLKFVLLVLPMKLQSSSQLEKTRIYLSDLISFLLYLVISLSIVNDLWFPLPVRKGLQRYKLFLNLQIFLYNFFKKFVIFPEHLYIIRFRPTICTASTKLST